ncbi:Zn-dependent oligopeptidase [Sphingomonas sinipercae]|uniref:Zn-dependent oligopeptidase n=1 Tax=Sphingomonas sinipercae TaxID=2714944 RepID=A0A6G7ZM26_9SPHN|nr:M3 family metallopeptidase [Sphingomonas sinipercae]QIL02034.1 Zn-dependent oligopeptidase [Sphingomonas sinipercae]
MRHHIALLLAGSALIASPSSSATQRTGAAIPPMLTGAPSAAAINARCNLFVARSTAMRKALETSKPSSSLNALTAYDRLQEVLTAGGGEATMFRQVSPTAASREAGEKCEVRMASEGTKLSLSRPAYERLKAIDATEVDAPTKLYLERTLGGFERAGIALDTAGRAKAQALSDDISSVNTQFEANIPKGQRTITATVAELDGLPQDFLDAHKPGPDGKITLRTDSTDYVPVMTYANSSALRQRFYTEYMQRAYPQNDPVLRQLINTRDEFAKLVGRPNYATLNFEDRMLNTPAKVQALIDDMAAAAKPAADRDYAKKLALLQQTQPGATKIEPWDNSYLSRLVQKQSYGYDRQEARNYFAYDNVRDGILQLTERMFGVDIRPWNTPKWDKLVESYEMYDDGKLIGRFYFDSHPRPGKYEHANAVPIRLGTSRQTPIAALVMNLPAGDHSTGLMEHRDVETFLHEYGHLLHYIFGGQTPRWAGQSGVATEWDFVEAPSQMLENWVYDYDTLKTFAVNASGQPIPRELVQKMNNARYFDLGMGDMRQLALTNIALQYYLRPAPEDLGAAARAASAKYDTLAMPAFAQMQDSFSHLGGYGAAYYTYRWSVVIADDLFTEFERRGLQDAATADRYRRLVLAPGGTRPAADLVADFLGRPISLDAYRAKLAKDK